MIDDMQRVSVFPGDRFVLHVKDLLSFDMCRKMQDHYSKLLGAPVVVIDGGMKLTVVGLFN
jgi:hypothetical protein